MKIILIVQGERRFFRVCYRWLANEHPEIARRNMELIPEYRRWDDVIYSLVGTLLEEDALYFIKKQLALDVECKAPSLLGKWLPSENASSKETRKMGNIVREYLGMTHRQYRKTLSILRERINVLERLMSAGRWDEIEFDKIPSRAGLIYKNAFARRDLIAKKYETFAKDKNTKVNAKVLYPHEIAHLAFRFDRYGSETDRLMIQKYWDSLPDYYEGRKENSIWVVDTSGSMLGIPLEVAVALGLYAAERNHGPFANYFITFSSHPELIRVEGVDIVDKIERCSNANWGMNTDIKAVFDLLLDIAKKKNVKQEDIPGKIYIASDMEFDGCAYFRGVRVYAKEMNTLMERIAMEWAAYGYKLPKLVFWNLDSRKNNIPAIGEGFSYVSGFSPSIMKTLLSGKDGVDLMLEVLCSDRYDAVK